MDKLKAYTNLSAGIFGEEIKLIKEMANYNEGQLLTHIICTVKYVVKEAKQLNIWKLSRQNNVLNSNWCRKSLGKKSP